MSKGFIWICQNNRNTDYVELSVALAKSIKKFNRHNTICVLTDKNTKVDSEYIDIVLPMEDDDSEQHDIKWANEYKVFLKTPFKHSIKLAADMLWTCNTDWWWYHLWKHNMVFSKDCYDYQNRLVKKQTYRPFHGSNVFQNIYSDLTYFRKSREVYNFGKTCEGISKNWNLVRDTMLRNCHDEYPSTDVVYALAQRITDPLCEKFIDFPWFKIAHNKKAINGLDHVVNNENYLMPVVVDGKIIHGGHVQTRPLHYVNKNYLEQINARIF